MAHECGGYEEHHPLAGAPPLQEGDMRDAALLSKVINDVEAVFHLAASVRNVRSIEKSIEDSEVDVIEICPTLSYTASHLGWAGNGYLSHTTGSKPK